MMLFLLLFAS